MLCESSRLQRLQPQRRQQPPLKHLLLTVMWTCQEPGEQPAALQEAAAHDGDAVPDGGQADELMPDVPAKAKRKARKKPSG